MSAKRNHFMESLVDGLLTRLFLIAARLTGNELL